MFAGSWWHMTCFFSLQCGLGRPCLRLVSFEVACVQQEDSMAQPGTGTVSRCQGPSASSRVIK